MGGSKLIEMKYIIAIFIAALFAGCQTHQIQTKITAKSQLSDITGQLTNDVSVIMPPKVLVQLPKSKVPYVHTNEVVWLWWTNNCAGNPNIFTGVRHTFDLKKWSMYYETNCVQPIDACCITCNLQSEFFQAFNSLTP
jgi:hypothetical protein